MGEVRDPLVDKLIISEEIISFVCEMIIVQGWKGKQNFPEKETSFAIAKKVICS